MNQERCKLEQIAVDRKLPFLSIKADELVFNPGYYNDPEFQIAIGDVLDGNRISESRFGYAVHQICHHCKLCTPRINTIRQRVERLNYHYNAENPSLFEIKEYIPDNHPLGRYVFIDDLPGEAESMARYYKNRGYTTYCIQTKPSGGRASHDEELLFTQTVLDLNPDIVITDKGLGYLSGLTLIENIRQRTESITTVLLTGEWDTRETHQIAHYFLTKPISGKELNKILLPEQ